MADQKRVRAARKPAARLRRRDPARHESAEAAAPPRVPVALFRLEGLPARIEGGSVLQLKEVSATVKGSFVPGTARAAGAAHQVTVLSSDVIEIEFEDGVRLWMSGDDYQAQFLKGASREAGAPTVPMPSTLNVLPTGMQSRGPVGWAVKALRIFGIDLGENTARKIAGSVDHRFSARRPGLGLYACSLRSDSFALTEPAPSAEGSDKPLLLFLHGTASSAWGSFGELWSPARSRERAELARFYEDRVAAFEHASLSLSPVENALELVRLLPRGARLHLVSHSRGGLVGELLCRANRTSGVPFDSVEIEAYGKALDARAQELKEPSTRQRHEAALRELNDLLRKKQVVVERFVRVACPALGTTLASRRLDRWLSVIGSVCSAALPGTPLSDWLSDIGDFMASVISEKTDPATLPGLEAMMPDSGLIRLVNWPEVELGGQLAVIAGDIAPEAWWSKLLVWVTDRFYDGEHDLVVNTASMSGGAKRVEPALLSFHQGAAVNHFNYFQNADSAGRLVLALKGQASVETGFRPLVPPAGPIARAVVIKPSAGPRPVVFLLPGIMGSELTVNDGTVWIDIPKLMFGGLARIAMGATGVRARQPVVRYYGDLSLYLAESHRVIDFAYDWRLPPEDEAARLAKAVAAELESAQSRGQPVRILAHSMGGLIARTMIANHPKVWMDMCKRPGARLVMLGTPNGGSHSITEMIVGRSATMKGLGVLDLKHDLRELLGIVTRFPGVLAMLPKDPAEDWFDHAVWSRYAALGGDGWVPPAKEDLARARRFRDTIDRALVDPERMVYVAGMADATPAGLALDPGTNRIQVLATAQGDGRVTWDSGIPPGVPTWYMNAEHGDLSAHEPAFPAIRELLESGKTTRLPQVPKVSRGAAALFPMPRDTDAIYPSEEALSAMAMGTRPRRRAPARAAEPPVVVTMLHGDLAHARYPVVLGHYAGDTILSAEKALDDALGGALVRRQRLGLYPGAVGTNAVFANPNLAQDPDASPRGAVVIGLGTPGQLTAGIVARALRLGLLEHVLAACQQTRPGGGAPPVRFSVSALLIGTGGGGVSVADSVYGLLKGVVATNESLAASGQRERIAAVEIVELYEDRAIQGVKALQDMRRNPDLDRAFNLPTRLECATGGLRRVSFDEPGGWWQRIQVLGGGKAGEPADGSLRFSAATRRARAEVRLQRAQLKLVDEFVEQAIRQTADNEEVARTLFELLLPNEFKDQAPDQDNTVLLLDEESARFPWELLRDPLSPGRKPTAVEHGMLRQLESSEYREAPRVVSENAALVVGDPASRFPALPGAQHEAETVARVLRAKGTVVEELIKPTAPAVLQALYKQPYRILHLAGHGVYRYLPEGSLACDACGQRLPEDDLRHRHEEADRITGMVIGDNAFLTPVEVAQMRNVPELVFINCCHLGYVEGQTADEASQNLRRDLHRIAANVSTEFIRMGVRAVIAAGWAVDDAAASTFAKRFYEEMLGGSAFGKAVREARAAAWEAAPHLNTWGAYQCYGDPDFRLARDGNGGSARGSDAPFASASEAVAALDNLASRLAIAATDPGPDRDRLAKLTQQLDAQGLLERPEVMAAAGRAWGEAQDFDKAAACLRAALGADNGTLSSRDIDMLASLEAREAARLWDRGEKGDAIRHIDTAIGRLEALVRAASPDALVQGAGPAERAAAPGERIALLANALKRKAVMTTGRDRIELLTQALTGYRKACDKGLGEYPLVNALMLRLALAWQRGGLSAAARRELLGEARRLDAELEGASATRRDFRTAAMRGDVALIEALCGTATRPGMFDGARERYRAATRRGNPRELESALEPIDFLVRMADEQPAVARLLDALRNELAPRKLVPDGAARLPPSPRPKRARKR